MEPPQEHSQDHPATENTVISNPVSYSKEALSAYHKRNYLQSLQGHTDFNSANTLRNSVKLAINFDSTTDRFKMLKKGGHFAINTAPLKSSFDKKVSYLPSLNFQTYHYPVKPDPETLKNGRPIFQRELSRDTPGPDVYDVKRNTDIKEVNTKRPCLFGHSFEHYRRTCDIQKGIKVFDYAANKSNPAPLYPNVENNKRRFPAFS